jgi:hypothetical protein
MDTVFPSIIYDLPNYYKGRNITIHAQSPSLSEAAVKSIIISNYSCKIRKLSQEVISF